MKKIYLPLIILLILPAFASAEEADDASVYQKMVLGMDYNSAHAESDTVSVAVSMGISLPNSSFPEIIFTGSGDVDYLPTEDGMLIEGRAVPPLTGTQFGYSGTIQGGKYGKINVEIYENNNGDMVVEAHNVDLSISIENEDTGEAMVSFNLNDIEMTSGRLVKSIDGETFTIEGSAGKKRCNLVFFVTLPEIGNDLFDDNLAGETLAGRLTVDLRK